MATVTLTVLDDRTTRISSVGDRVATLSDVDDRSVTARLIDDRATWLTNLDERWVTISAVVELSVSTVALSGGEIGDVSNTTLDLTWGAAVASLSSTYTLGLTVTVNGVPVSVTSATLQPGSQVVRVVLASAADADDVVAVAYDQTTGDLVDGNGLEVASASATAANNVGTHLYFDQADDSAHLLTSL